MMYLWHCPSALGPLNNYPSDYVQDNVVISFSHYREEILFSSFICLRPLTRRK